MWWVERGEIASPSEQRPLGTEEGTTRRSRAPADPLDVEGDAATALSRGLSSASLMRFRSSPAAPCLYISRRRRRRSPTQRCAFGCRDSALPLHAGSAIGEARARVRVRAEKGGLPRRGEGRGGAREGGGANSQGREGRECKSGGGRTRRDGNRDSDTLRQLVPLCWSLEAYRNVVQRYFRLSQPGIDGRSDESDLFAEV